LISFDRDLVFVDVETLGLDREAFAYLERTAADE